MKALFFIFTFFVMYSLLGAETPEGLVREALNWEDAGNGERALEIYERILRMQIEPWQRARVRYNMGTVQLKLNEWTKSLEEFNALASRNNLSPEIFLKSRINSAVALIGKSEEWLSALEEQQVLSPLQALVPLSMMKEARNSCQEAHKELCIIKEWQGFNHCPEDDCIELIQGKIFGLMNDILIRKERYQWQNMSLQDALNTLRENIKHFNEAFALVKDTALNPQALQSFKNEFKISIPLWNRLLELSTSLQPQYKNYMVKAAEAFKEASEKFNKGDIAASFLNMQKTLAFLDDARKFLPILPQPLATLERANKKISALLDAELDIDGVRAFKENLQEAYKANNLSLSTSQNNVHPQLWQKWRAWAEAALEKKQNRIALVFLTALQQDLNNAWKSNLSAKANITAQTELKTLIEQQHQALNIALIADPLGSQNQIDANLIMLLSSLQEDVVQNALAYGKQIVNWQKERYEDRQRQSCLEKPWDLVVPAFFMGYLSAAEAKSEFTDALPAFVLALDAQRNAITQWKEALKMLEESEKEQSTSTASSSSSEAKSADVIVQDLMEMELEDRPSKASGIATPNIEKPW